MFFVSRSICYCISMPTEARIDTTGALHHVIIQGIERKKIFRSDYDREKFLKRLCLLIPDTQTDCFAWAFVEKGVAAGSRPDLIGGELLRSTGGWKLLKGHRKAGIRVKGMSGIQVTAIL